MAGDVCKDAGEFGIKHCRWRRLEVCCSLWGGACRYLGRIRNEAKGGKRLDVRHRQMAEGGVVGNSPHKPGGNADVD